jgi:hypothetical protein
MFKKLVAPIIWVRRRLEQVTANNWYLSTKLSEILRILYKWIGLIWLRIGTSGGFL